MGESRRRKAELERALLEADLRVLLMVLFHYSGDEKWLSDTFAPVRDVRLIADKSAGFSPEHAAEIRAAALELLADGLPVPAIPHPDDALLLRMMRHCLGENVAPEYAPMMAEQMGFSPLEEAVPQPSDKSSCDRLPVLIVGAGVSGIVLGKLLLQRGIPFRIVDMNEDVGGTWLENRYPGCGVDTPNHAYSFSFGERYPWSQYFSPRDEIHDYLKRTAQSIDLYPHISFRTEVKAAKWDEQARCWKVSVTSPQGPESLDAAILISAVGQLNLPLIPELQGINTFSGELFHSSRWPVGLDLSGKRVALVGTGASSMQIAPSIADEVASLDIYQRTPQWARPIPHYQDKLGEGAQYLLQELPFYAAWFRFAMFWRYGDGLLPYLRKDPDWIHPERSLNRVNERHRVEMLDHITKSLDGREDLVQHCVPSYPPYGKRILLDNGWYNTLLRDNVNLVPRSVERVTETGVVCSDGEHREADVVILATGFQVGKMAARLNITGRDGLKLKQVWAPDNPSAYLGISVAGFPNLFSTMGPATGLGHGGSAIFQAECQARYIVSSIVAMLDNQASTMEVRPEVQAEFVRKVDEAHEEMIWTHPGLSTYYRNSVGRVFSLLPWRLVDYWHLTREPELSDYQLG